MGLNDDELIGAFRQTRDGRRIWRMRYLVPDADLGRVESRIKTSAMFSIPVVTAIAIVARGVWGHSWGWVAMLLVFPVNLLTRSWVSSGLPVVVVHDTELEPVNEQELAVARIRALGRPAQLALVAVALAMSVLAADLIFIDGDRSWTSWLLLIVMPICFVGMCRDLWHLRKESSKP